jgi:hypothetical protein
MEGKTEISSAVFGNRYQELFRLALALSGDEELAAEIVRGVQNKVAAEACIGTEFSLLSLKQSIIEESIRRVQIFKEELSEKIDRRWTQQLPWPFHSDLARILFVLRIWEGLPVSAVCRYSGLLPEDVKALLAKIFESAHQDSDILYFFVLSFKERLQAASPQCFFANLK